MSFSDGVVYYHYTDQSSAHIIKKTRKILESTDTVNAQWSDMGSTSHGWTFKTN